MKLRNTFRPRLEQLDDRALPSVSLVNGILTVGGTAGADAIQVTRATGGKILVKVSSTGEARRFTETNVTKIELNGGNGNDRIVIGSAITIASEIHGGRGIDTILGGGGDDAIFGHQGNDVLRGRGGNDDIHGEDGNDDIRGGVGDDHMDGGNGRDNCNGQDGNDDIVNGMDQETELVATLAGTGNGSASFGFNLSSTETEREFEVEVEDLTAGTIATVFVDGVPVGSTTINGLGNGRVDFSLDFDSNHDGVLSFPGNFPEIHAGSTIEVKVSGAVVLSGTFA